VTEIPRLIGAVRPLSGVVHQNPNAGFTHHRHDRNELESQPVVDTDSNGDFIVAGKACFCLAENERNISLC
jgi:hypothetical protein